MIGIVKTTASGTELFKWERKIDFGNENDYIERGVFALRIEDGYFVRLQVIRGSAPLFADVLPLVVDRWDATYVAERGKRDVTIRRGMSGCLDVAVVQPLGWDEDIYIPKPKCSLHISCTGKLNQDAECPAVCFAVAALVRSGDFNGLSNVDAVLKEGVLNGLKSPAEIEEETDPENILPAIEDLGKIEEIVVEGSNINEIKRLVDDVWQHMHDGCEYWHPIARVHKFTN